MSFEKDKIANTIITNGYEMRLKRSSKFDALDILSKLRQINDISQSKQKPTSNCYHTRGLVVKITLKINGVPPAHFI